MQRSIEIREDNLDSTEQVINISQQKHASRISKLKRLIFNGVPGLDEQLEQALDSSRSKSKQEQSPRS